MFDGLETAIGLTGILVGVVGIVVGLRIHERFMLLKKMSWNKIKKGIKALIIHIEQFKPDLIIGISGGGAIVAELIAVNWHTYSVVTLDVYGRRVDGERIIEFDPEKIGDLSGKKVVLIDSELYSGQSMQVVKDFVKNTKHATEVKTCTVFLLKEPQAQLKPDHFVYEVRRRVAMPWSFTDEYERKYYRSWL